MSRVDVDAAECRHYVDPLETRDEPDSGGCWFCSPYCGLCGEECTTDLWLDTGVCELCVAVIEADLEEGGR